MPHEIKWNAANDGSYNGFSFEFGVAFMCCWAAIAADVDVNDNWEAIEVCVDADRLLLIAESPAAHAEWRARVERDGRQAALAALDAEFKLV